MHIVWGILSHVERSMPLLRCSIKMAMETSARKRCEMLFSESIGSAKLSSPVSRFQAICIHLKLLKLIVTTRMLARPSRNSMQFFLQWHWYSSSLYSCLFSTDKIRSHLSFRLLLLYLVSLSFSDILLKLYLNQYALTSLNFRVPSWFFRSLSLYSRHTYLMLVIWLWLMTK